MTALLALVLLACTFGVWAVLRTRDDVAPLFAMSLLIYLVLWNAFPVLYGLTMMDWAESLSNERDYRRLAVLHLGTLLLTTLLFVMLPARVHRGMRDLAGQRPTAPRTALWILAATAIVFAASAQYAFRLRGGSFSASVAFAVTATAGESAKAAITDVVASLALSLGIAALLTSWPQHRKQVTTLAWGIVAIHVVNNLLLGIRAVILLPLILIVARNWQSAREGRRVNWLPAGIAFGGTLLLAPLLAAAMGVIRLGGADKVDLAAVQQGYDVAVAALTPAERARLAAVEMNRKFDAISTGASLLEREGSGAAGWRPYTSSLLAPIPRALLPGKPVPTSKNGDIGGTPYRVAAEPFGNVELGTVVPVTPVAIAIWEVGLPGMALVVAFNLVAWILANSLLAAGSLLERTFGVMMLALPTTEFLFAPPSALVRDLLRLALYLLVLYLGSQLVSLHRAAANAVPRAQGS